MVKNAGVCLFEDCRNIGQVRQLPYAPEARGGVDGRADARARLDLVEICGTHWPESRTKTADRAGWLAVLREGSLSFEAVAART
jgi:hypothetical protein